MAANGSVIGIAAAGRQADRQIRKTAGWLVAAAQTVISEPTPSHITGFAQHRGECSAL